MQSPENFMHSDKATSANVAMIQVSTYSLHTGTSHRFQAARNKLYQYQGLSWICTIAWLAEACLSFYCQMCRALPQLDLASLDADETSIQRASLSHLGTVWQGSSSQRYQDQKAEASCHVGQRNTMSHPDTDTWLAGIQPRMSFQGSLTTSSECCGCSLGATASGMTYKATIKQTRPESHPDKEEGHCHQW